jgi:hypothetical protein
MIRINLLKNLSDRRKPRNRNAGQALKIFVVGSLVCALLTGGLYAYRWVQKNTKKPAVEKQLTVKKELAPSTYSGDVVEDVVKEVNDSRQKLRESGILELPYDQMSFSEKINYEYIYTKKVCEMLSRIIPDGIGLKSLETDNFQTVYAVGIGTTKDIIEKMFTALKKENVTVLPQPYSFVKPSGKDGFRFAFSCQTRFGLNLADPSVDGSLARLPSRESIASVLKKFMLTAESNHVSITKKPVQASVEKVGNYYRYIYEWSGTSSYKDFVKFAFDLSDSGVTSALKRCNLSARTSTEIKIESQIVITARE